MRHTGASEGCLARSDVLRTQCTRQSPGEVWVWSGGNYFVYLKNEVQTKMEEDKILFLDVGLSKKWVRAPLD